MASTALGSPTASVPHAPGAPQVVHAAAAWTVLSPECSSGAVGLHRGASRAPWGGGVCPSRPFSDGAPVSRARPCLSTAAEVGFRRLRPKLGLDSATRRGPRKCFCVWELRRDLYLLGVELETRATFHSGLDHSGSVGASVLSDRPAPWGPTFPCRAEAY